MASIMIVARMAGAAVLGAGLIGAVILTSARPAGAEMDMWDQQRARAQELMDGTTGTWDVLKEQLFPQRTIADGAGVVTMEIPPRVPDASGIPIRIKAMKPQSAHDFIKNIYLVADENPDPVAAVFHLSPDTGVATVSTIIRLDKFTHVRAIAETNGGKLYMASHFFKVAGGCSAPGLTDPEEAMARMGKMKFEIVKPGGDGEPTQAHLIVSHPNYTGMQFDQIARYHIPAEFVKSIDLSYGDTKLLSIESGFSISENPTYYFYFLDRGPGELKAVVKDSEGRVFEKSWPVSTPAKG